MKTLKELGCETDFSLHPTSEDQAEARFARCVKRNIKPECWEDESSLLFAAACEFQMFRHTDTGFKIL